ncbi:MAG TPA: DUF6551 family protein [Mycobacteriales bacterium]|nr:DUF6551 family protein [Mycobacteriales bacterium]
MKKPNGNGRAERNAALRWVPIDLMRTSPVAQRELNQARVDKLAANFDLEMLGTPTVSKRDGHFYIVDGQHRIEALKEIGWGDQQIQCWTYEGLTEAEEAEKWLVLNDVLTQSAYDKFARGVVAGRLKECDIDRIVRAQGLAVSRAHSGQGAISAVGTLTRIYDRAGPAVLARTLRIIRDAYGDAGFEAAIIDGIGLLCARYNGDLEDQIAVAKLAKINGSASGLLAFAYRLRAASHQSLAQSVAAAAVDVINAGRGGKKLPSWFREDAAA